jgi:histidine triad (HIT) family protein
MKSRNFDVFFNTTLSKRGKVESIGSGSYAVLYYLKKDQEIQISKLGKYLFKKGYYLYSGSAKKNLKKRVSRHIRKDNKKLKWHIDFFVDNTFVAAKKLYIFRLQSECDNTRFFLVKGGEVVVKKFGSSDCKKNCQSHFLYFGNKYKINQGQIVYEDEDIVALKDIHPQASVHILIVPRKHIPTLLDMTEEDEKLVGKMVLVAANLSKEFGISSRGFRLVFNCNKEAGQSIYHIHLHLIGGRKMNWPPG